MKIVFRFLWFFTIMMIFSCQSDLDIQLLKNGQVFEIKLPQKYKPMTIEFWSVPKSEILWTINKNYSESYSSPRVLNIDYGEVNRGFIQSYPDGSKPRYINENEIIAISITYQFDTWISANVGSRVWTFTKHNKIFEPVEIDKKKLIRP